MKVTSCKSSGMEVSPTTYNACTFQIIDKWNPDQHAKTCDTMFYLSDGTGAYVWDCDHWTFLDFTGVTQSDWAAKQNEAGYIKNKPFTTLGNGLSVDEKGVLNVNLTLEPIMYTAYANSADGNDGFTTVYPNLNLLKNTKLQSYVSTSTSTNNSSNIYTLDVVVSDIINKRLTISYDYEITNVDGAWSGYIRPTYGLGGVNKPVSNDDFKGSVKQTITLTNLNQTAYSITTSGLPTGAKVTITNLKLEFGSTSTIWMPSASEVTTADWPKYAGHYASLSKEQSLDPKKYIWDSSETNTVNSVNGKSKDVILKGTDIIVSADDSRTVSEAIKDSGGGKATSAEKLSTARDLKVDLTSKLAQSFDGSADATTIGVTGTLPLANGGTGNNKGEAIPKTTTPNTSLTNGTINTNAKNAVLKYRILNDVIYISGSIDVVASDSNGESIKVGNIPEQYQPKKLINGVGKVHLNVGLFSKGFENAQVVVVGDENAAAKGAVMFSVQSSAKLTAGTWTFFGSYNLI